MLTALNRLLSHVGLIHRGEHDKIGPGVPAAMSRAMLPGEGGAQGDLYIVVGDGVPAGYRKVDNPTDNDRQLVFGNTQGARHCLDSLEGVEIFRPANWNADSLDGPYLKITQERVITHPRHGDVRIPADMEVLLFYPQDFDLVRQQARRAAD